MSVDARTRRYCDTRNLARDEVFDGVLVEAATRHGELAARGLRASGLPALALEVGDRTVSLAERDGALRVLDGVTSEAAVVRLDARALSEWVQDRKSAMGLAMNAQASTDTAAFGAWIGWEPVIRALLDARPVHEAGAVVLRDRSGAPLDPSRRFSLDDDRAEMAHFLVEAGFLHVTDVFRADEMDAVSRDLDAALAEAAPHDGASWWAGDDRGVEQPVRVLFFHEKSEALRALLADERLTWLASLTGDAHDASQLGAEGLVKPLRIRTGLSDLPWHKDCGQGGHSYVCSGLTVGLSITGADERSGALGVVPGSHRANIPTAGRDDRLDLPSRKLATAKGDLTVHCGDTLHRAHPPIDRPRKVVYTGIRLKPLEGDVLPEVPTREQRAARARLSDVRDRIAAAGAGSRA